MKIVSTALFVFVVLISACWPIENERNSCYRIEDGKVYLRYYGGYPRAKEVLLEVKGADAKSFEYIKGSREGSCQGGHMFGKDQQHVFYRTQIIPFAEPDNFVALSYGYSKSGGTVFYREEAIDKVDGESFFVIENKRKQAYAADKHGLIVAEERIGGKIDAKSFKLLPKPYSKDKNKVYYSEKFKVLQGADPASFTCPMFKSIVNFQYYAFDKNNAYYYEKGKIERISKIDFESFKVLSTQYAKDKNRVYYKSKVLENAHTESFQVPTRINKHVATDKNHRYVNGAISDN